MKKLIYTVLVLSIPFSSSLMGRELADYSKNTEALYRQGGGAGAEDGGYTAIGMSMLGWGLGIAAGIAVLAAILPQSKSSSSHSKNAHCH